MNLDIRNTIRQYLPTFLRGNVTNYVRDLLVVISSLYDLFSLFKKEKTMDARVTSQFIVFEQYLEDKLNVGLVKIRNGNGLLPDFYVSINGEVDYARALAIVNKHKLFGKTVRVLASENSITSFINHVCEKAIPVVDVSFINHVCEKEMVFEVLNVEFLNHVCELDSVGDFDGNDFDKNDFNT